MVQQYYKQSKPSLSFGEAITSVLSKYAIFSGRARRSEYWYFMLAYYILEGIFLLATWSIIMDAWESGYPLSFLDNHLYIILNVVGSVVGLILFLPSLAVSVRRLHDTNKSGWNILWSIVPFIGILMLFVWTLQDSDPLPNDYGPSPKYDVYRR